MHFYPFTDMQFKLKREGVRVKAVSGENVQMLRIRLDPGFESDHSHPEEQIGLVLSGTVRLTIGGEERTCGEGIAYHIPAGVRHSFKVISAEPAEILDIFSPPKEENRI